MYVQNSAPCTDADVGCAIALIGSFEGKNFFRTIARVRNVITPVDANNKGDAVANPIRACTPGIFRAGREADASITKI